MQTVTVYPKKVRFFHVLKLLFISVPVAIIWGWAKPLGDYTRLGLLGEHFTGLWHAIRNNEEWGYGFIYGNCKLNLLQRVQEYSFYSWDSMLDEYL